MTGEPPHGALSPAGSFVRSERARLPAGCCPRKSMPQSDAVVFTAKNQVTLARIDVPDPGPGDVLVRTRFSWISNGTEGSFLRCERVDGITPWQPGMEGPYPMVPGYQKTGVIEWIGPEARAARPELEPGQWVFATV